jgi:aspartyl-tRNA(Asn)/glutamyl-tRNA(Gln) amidotransferase subunit B
MSGIAYETVIGLEVHVELSTLTKVFCGCPTQFGAEENTHCCPVCTGMPGALPVINKKAVEYAILAGLATHCEINRYSKMDRKNYFYPDLPKAYQISQYDLPLCKSGFLEIETESGETKKIRLNRIHLEEDAGKLVHAPNHSGSLLDMNRCGVPLLEIVTEPDMRGAQEARDFLENIKKIMEYIRISDCKMEEGSMRCDVNLSVRPASSDALGIRTETKNLNSFRSITRVIESETARQIQLLEQGVPVVQATLHWDEDAGETSVLRLKEEAQDYRYFPDPDLAPVHVDDAWFAHIRSRLPELPEPRRKRFIEQYTLPAGAAALLTSEAALADYYEAAAEASQSNLTACHWVTGELLRLLKEKEVTVADSPIGPGALGQLIKFIDRGAISGSQAKEVFDIMAATGESPESVIRSRNLVQISDSGQLEEIAARVIQSNPKSANDYLAGKEKALGFLVGQMMKESKGKANPKLAGEILTRLLNQS